MIIRSEVKQYFNTRVVVRKRLRKTLYCANRRYYFSNLVNYNDSILTRLDKEFFKVSIAEKYKVIEKAFVVGHDINDNLDKFKAEHSYEYFIMRNGHEIIYTMQNYPMLCEMLKTPIDELIKIGVRIEAYFYVYNSSLFKNLSLQELDLKQLPELVELDVFKKIFIEGLKELSDLELQEFYSEYYISFLIKRLFLLNMFNKEEENTFKELFVYFCEEAEAEAREEN